jgi:hypothetical protein
LMQSVSAQETTQTEIPKTETVETETLKKNDSVVPSDLMAVKQKQEFEKTQRLEKLRYEHLWIAYALIWLAIFVFIWKTWQKSVAQDQKIAELAQKISQFEQKSKKES